MPRDDLEEALDILYPHLRGTHKIHDALAAHYAQIRDENNKEKVVAREAWDRREEREIHDLAEKKGSTEEVLGARAVIRSWSGESIEEIAKALKVRQRSVLVHLLRFNVWGVEGLKRDRKEG